jgi:cardiolipin synthase
MSAPARRKPEKHEDTEKAGKEGGGRLPTFFGRTVEVSFATATLFLLLILFLVILLWSTQREHESHVRVPAIEDFEQALPSIAVLAGSPLVAGNKVEVLQNGDGFFPPLFADIAGARRSIHLETYVWWQGEVCKRLAYALAKKAREGVEVRVTLDATGSHQGDDELFDMMKENGVKIALFHPVRLADLGLVNQRTHRKVAVVDGRVAYVFGHGIADEWTGHAQDEKHWRDTGVRLQGPIVNSVQAVFAENWMDTTAEVLFGNRYFPAQPIAGSVRAHMTASSPSGGVSRMELLDKMAIASAKERLVIQNPYFIPDDELVALLEAAVKRGVDVILMIPGPVTDSSIVRHAGHRHFGELLEKGIKIFEFQRTLSHQKIMIVDGVWSLVGSTNFDDRSLDINDEASVGLIDRGVAAELEAAFTRMSYMLNEQL